MSPVFICGQLPLLFVLVTPLVNIQQTIKTTIVK